MSTLGVALSLGRRMAESRMIDECSVTRAGGPVWDEETGEEVTSRVSVYSGPCRVRHPSSAARDAESGSQLVVVSALEVHFPVTATGLADGDVVEITKSPSRHDQVGRKFTISGPFDGSQTTALRYRVEVSDGR